MGNKERDKGARGERLLRDFLRDRGLDVRRGFTYLHQSDLIGMIGIHVECKFVEKLNVRKALQQATDEAKKRSDGMPTVFWKVSRLPWITIMWSEDWITLYKLARTKNPEAMKEVIDGKDS